MNRSSPATRKLLLSVVETDNSFEPCEYRGGAAWMGRCLHCGKHMFIAQDGTPLNGATVEHIVPSSAGGSDDAMNLGIACAPCNHRKGTQHDHSFGGSPRARDVVERLLKKRRQRWREPAEG